MKAKLKYKRSIFTGLLLMVATILGAQPTLRLSPEEITAIPGQEIEVDLIMEGFGDVLSFYIPISWDAAILEFVAVSNFNSSDFSGYDGNNFFTPETIYDPGEMGTFWALLSGSSVSVPDSTVIFTLTLRTINEGAARVAIEGDPALELLDPLENPISPDLSASTVSVYGSCRERDSLGLIELYEATNGPEWTNGWDLNAPMETWEGVTLNAVGCVTEVSLADNNLNGQLPDLNLPDLEELFIISNPVTGSLPDFNNLPNLEQLVLVDNQLSGPLPDFGNLPNLILLSLVGNQLSNSVPDFSNLPNLELLNLGRNEFSGPVPDFSNLSNLKRLLLNNNQLSGTIPDFTNLPNLVLLNLGRNNLTGEIPDFIGLPNLEELYLDGGELSGTIPDFQNVPNLDRLRIDANELTGPIPDFTGIPNLERLDADSNRLDGPVPDLSNLPNLVFLDFFNNELSGPVPDFTDLPALEELYLDNNNLSGPIPDFSSLPNLRVLDLGGNNDLTGIIPDFTKLPQLERLDLTVTKLKANIPPLFNCPLLNDLEVERNRLTFENILPNFGALNDRITQNAVDTNDVFLYSPQDPIYPDTLFTRPAGEAFTIDLGIDAGVTDNLYTWYKDGALFRTITGNNQLTFDPLTTGDAGVYTVEVTNPGAPELTLESGEITIEMSPAIRLIAGEASGNPGDEVLLPILAENADGLAALQGKVSFRQPGVAEVLGVEPARMQPVLNIADGQFNFFDETGLGLALAPLDTLFYLRLRLTGARGSTSEVFFEDGENFELSAHLFDGDIVEADIETVEGLVTVLEAVSISGRIALYNDRPVAGVTVTAIIEQPNGQRVEQQEVTDANGNYRFAEVPLGSRVRVEPVRNADMAAPVNSSGLLYALQAFLDGTPAPTLTSPLQLAAADVDCDGRLTTGDLLLFQEVMTGLRPGLPDCPVWTFTPESRLPDFRLEARYFPGFPIPGRRIIGDLSGEAIVNFAGIKTGDVMGEAQTP